MITVGFGPRRVVASDQSNRVNSVGLLLSGTSLSPSGVQEFDPQS